MVRLAHHDPEVLEGSKGQAICAFVSVKAGVQNSPALVDELKGHVAKKIGPIARPDEILFAAELPKTRSGKIMRRLLRDIADGRWDRLCRAGIRRSLAPDEGRLIHVRHRGELRGLEDRIVAGHPAADAVQPSASR